MGTMQTAVLWKQLVDTNIARETSYIKLFLKDGRNLWINSDKTTNSELFTEFT
jgi:hypothetical protein